MPYERPGAATASKVRSTIWNVVALFVGWTVFFYWWRIVLEQTTSRTFWSLILGIGVLVLILVLSSIAWVLYNLRLAARGRRNRETRYGTGVIEHDKLDRRIAMADVHELRDAAIVVIHTDQKHKRYEVGANRGDH